MSTQVATTTDGRPILVADKTQYVDGNWKRGRRLVPAYEQPFGSWSAYIGDVTDDTPEPLDVPGRVE